MWPWREGGSEPEELSCCPRSRPFPRVNSRNIPYRECISPPSPSLWFSFILWMYHDYLPLSLPGGCHVASCILGILQKKNPKKQNNNNNKNSLDAPDVTRQLRAKMPAHDSITVASSMVHNLGFWVWLQDSPAWRSPLLTLAAEWHLGETPLTQILPLLLN